MQDPSSFSDRITGLPLPAQAVENLINRKLGEAMQIGAAVRVVDSLLQPVACMPDGSNDIGPLIAPADAIVTHDSTRSVHRTCRLTLLDPWYVPGMGASFPFPFNPIEQFLHISQRLTCAGISIEVPLGYYTMLWPTATISRGRRFFAWSGTDLTELVNRIELISDYTVAKGYTGGYRGAILDALEIAAVPKSLGGTGATPQGNDLSGPAIPRELVDIADSASTDISADLFFPAGTVMLDMVNQLLDQGVNYYPLTPLSTPYIMEANGVAAPGPIMGAYPKRLYSTDIPAADWDYSTAEDSSIVEAPLQQDVSSLLSAGAANIVRVVGGANSELGALRMNSNDASVFSVTRLRGLSGGPRALPHYERAASAATSQDMVDLYADLLIEQGAQVNEQIAVNSLHNPLHGDHDLLMFRVTDSSGRVVIDSDTTALFEEVAWSLPLKASGARQSHLLKRAAAV